MTVLESFPYTIKRDLQYLKKPLKDEKDVQRVLWTVLRSHFTDLVDEEVLGKFGLKHYQDDFGIQSYTLQTAWYQNLGEDIQLVPSLRYYSQREADFYLSVDDFSLPLSVNQSSDYRLSTYGAYTFGLKGIVSHNNWSVSISIDRYISSDRYALADANFKHPALLDFSLASLGFDIRF